MEHRVRYAAQAAATALAAALVLAGCGGEGGSPAADDSEPGSTTRPELIATWSEADDRAVELPAPEQLPDEPVDTEAEREELVTVLPPAEEVQDADLDEVLLLVGTYQDCAREGRVVGSGEDARFESFVVPDQKDVRCVWAPYTIEVWQVPRTGGG